MDFISKEKRSKIMSSIKGKSTKPEMLVRKYLFAKGFRYRLHCKGLPGKPDLCFPSKKVAVFVHGCFWHNHTCNDGHFPTSNNVFWLNKLTANKERDVRNQQKIDELGWKIIVVWECEIKKDIEHALTRLDTALK